VWSKQLEKCSYWYAFPLMLQTSHTLDCYVKQVHDYTEEKGQQCGSSATQIRTWADGRDAAYASEVDSLDICKATCSAHNDCKGFGWSTLLRRCSYWFAGPLSLSSSAYFNCHVKEVVRYIQEANQNCGSAHGSLDIYTWADGAHAAFNSDIQSLAVCRSICGSHSECAGFKHSKINGRCSFWYKGPSLQNTLTSASMLDCYVKVKIEYNDFETGTMCPMTIPWAYCDTWPLPCDADMRDICATDMDGCNNARNNCIFFWGTYKCKECNSICTSAAQRHDPGCHETTCRRRRTRRRRTRRRRRSFFFR